MTCITAELYLPTQVCLCGGLSNRGSRGRALGQDWYQGRCPLHLNYYSTDTDVLCSWMKKKNCKIFLTSGRSDCCSLQRSEAKGLARGEIWIEDMVWLSDQVARTDTSDHLSHPNLLALINVLHSCNKEIDLDIGKKEESLSNYRATLAHKCCHSFKPNSHFAQFWHPMWVISTSLNLLNSSTYPGTAWWRPETWSPARRSLSPTTTPSRRRPSGIRCCSRASRWFSSDIWEYWVLSLLTQAIWFAHLREDQGLSEQEIYEWCVR